MIAMDILRCRDGSYYVGSTHNLDARMQQLPSGRGSGNTSSRLLIELVFAEACTTADETYALEKRVQGWSRVKREALIRGDDHLLPGLSRTRFDRRDTSG